MLGLAALFGLSAQMLFFERLFEREAPGVAFPIAIALLLAIAWPWRRIRPAELWIPASALAFAAFVAVRADRPLLAFDHLAALGLAFASAVALNGTALTSLPAPRLARVAVFAAAAALAGTLAALRVGTSEVTHVRGGRLGRFIPAAAGLALALPFLFVFSNLFSSADAVFAQIVEDTLDEWLEALGELPGRAFIAAMAALVAAGGLTIALGGPDRGDAPTRWPLLHWTTAAVALVAIDLLFALFVVLQVTYLFMLPAGPVGGADTLVAAGMSYSEYARRGFFELIGVTVLVGPLLFGLELVIRDRTRPYRLAALFLVFFTGVVLVSAAYRLSLYQQAFGWTELRFYALAAIALLGAGLLVLAWGLALGRTAYTLQPLSIAVVVVALACNGIGPASFVARANIARALDTAALPEYAERELDVSHLVALGPGAWPDLVAALPSLQDGKQRFMRSYLLRIAPYVTREEPWQSWNLDRERAKAALGELVEEEQRSEAEGERRPR